MSASSVSRLKRQWKDEYEIWRKKRLDEDEWVYIWADGIYSRFRDEEKDSEKICVLVITGVNAQGKKHFLAIEDGTRESKQSWREQLCNHPPSDKNIKGLPFQRWHAGDDVQAGRVRRKKLAKIARL